VGGAADLYPAACWHGHCWSSLGALSMGYALSIPYGCLANADGSHLQLAAAVPVV